MSTRYVWEKWNCDSSTNYSCSFYISGNKHSEEDNEEFLIRSSFGSTFSYVKVATSGTGVNGYTVSVDSNGTFLCNGSAATSSQVSGVTMNSKNVYFIVNNEGTMAGVLWLNSAYTAGRAYTEVNNLYYRLTGQNTYIYYEFYKKTSSLIYSKGSTSYGNISSASSGAYPSDSYSGDYWYVLQGSDSIDPTISYPSSIFKNQNVKITVSPASNTYGGTISYKYEYTTDGSTWTTANSGTTATSVDVTIPSTATTFQARVTASDNMGFTSTTAVTGASVTVYDIDPTSVTYDAEALVAGDEITVTISPTTSGYSGTITYVIQTNVDGAGWETETETTSTNVPLTIPSDAVSWTVRVYAKTSDYTSSTYVYGNGATEGAEVKHGVGFNVIPENKHLGYLGSADLMQYYVSTDDSVSYVCAISLDGETVSSTSQTPGMKTLTISADRWEALTSGEEHTIEITATCNGKSIIRTYTFNKFVYDASTLPGLLDGIAEAIKVKMGVNRQLWGYKLPMEILKITNSADNYINAYIDVTAAYVNGMKVMAVSSTGEVYSTNADSSGTTRLEVSEKGDYIVTAKIGEVASESKKVSISADGDVVSAAVAFIKLTVTTVAGSTVTATLDSQSYSATATSGSAVMYLPSKGTWSVTAANGDLSSTKTVEVTAYETYALSIPLYDSVFGNNSWATIQAAVQSGVASSLWSVGDQKAVTLNGTVGGLTFSNETYYAFIIGFDHNADLEGSNKLHMMFGKTSDGTQIQYIDSYTSTGTGFCMNTTNVTTGGWEGSYMRGTIMPAMKAAFPSDLKAVLGSCTKYTHNTSGLSDNNLSSNITATVETVFLLAEYEIFGLRTGANSYEQNKQMQYAYFANGNSKVFYQYNSVGTARRWWSRSTLCPDAAGDSFCIVFTDGSETFISAFASCGVAPAFIIS